MRSALMRNNLDYYYAECGRTRSDDKSCPGMQITFVRLQTTTDTEPRVEQRTSRSRVPRNAGTSAARGTGGRKLSLGWDTKDMGALNRTWDSVQFDAETFLSPGCTSSAWMGIVERSTCKRFAPRCKADISHC